MAQVKLFYSLSLNLFFTSLHSAQCTVHTKLPPRLDRVTLEYFFPLTIPIHLSIHQSLRMISSLPFSILRHFLFLSVLLDLPTIKPLYGVRENSKSLSLKNPDLPKSVVKRASTRTIRPLGPFRASEATFPHHRLAPPA